MLIIHAADFHLGASPDLGESWGENRKQELWDSFERFIERVEEEQADLLLIAGDLFHRQPLLRELREVNGWFSSLTKTKVVLIAGNHDFVGKTSFYNNFSWAENVFFLGEKHMDSVAFQELKADVYGLSYTQKEIRERLYDEVKPEDNGYYHILLAHGGDEKHIPYTKEKLRNSGFDYIAFGHIHKPGMIVPGQAVMAGSLEPTDHTCKGPHGFVRVTVTEKENDICLVPFAKREYHDLKLELTPEDTLGSVFRSLKEKISMEGEQHIYDVILSGRRHGTLEILEEKLKSAGNVRVIIDETEKYFDYEGLKEQYRGSLLERYISSFENERELLDREALEVGTAAILEVLGV